MVRVSFKWECRRVIFHFSNLHHLDGFPKPLPLKMWCTEFNYRSVWKWSSCDGRWEERKAARRQRAPHWGQCLHLKLWCWSWSWGVSARRLGLPAAPALVRCRSHRSGKSGEFLCRWLEVNLEETAVKQQTKIKPSELDRNPKFDWTMWRNTKEDSLF